MSEFTPEVQALAAVVDRLGTLLNVILQTNGGKPLKLTPYPRPETAADRLRSERRRATHESLVARLLPPRDDDPA